MSEGIDEKTFTDMSNISLAALDIIRIQIERIEFLESEYLALSKELSSAIRIIEGISGGVLPESIKKLDMLNTSKAAIILAQNEERKKKRQNE